MFKPGTMVVIGVVAMVVGFIPPISILAVASGALCVYFGWEGLKKEEKENADRTEP